jgi:hypothetical protein
VLAAACVETRDEDDDGAEGVASGPGAGGSDDDAATNDASGGADADDGETGGGPKLDVGPPGADDGGGNGCADPGGAATVSYIWIVNTNDQPPTVVKIDTRTLEEEGRYLTRADGLGDPSRTSVALSGHAAVANRSGGITKYYAYDCPPGPTSAGGPDSELPWGDDACIAWSTDFDYETQRPVAWTPGTFDESSCTWQDELLWSSGANVGATLEVLRLDGETGALLDLVPVPGLDPGFYGAYGGAVDGDGNFWFTQLGIDGKNLVRVDAATLAVQIHPHTVAGYGMQVDGAGRPWVCGYDGRLARFTPTTGAWDVVDTGAEMFGCMPDDTRLWVGGLEGAIRGIDLETLQVVATFPLPMIDNPDIHGISIDFDGRVWGVSVGTMAARVDPATGAVEYVGGLQSPYTYSDMTGYALQHAGVPRG